MGDENNQLAVDQLPGKTLLATRSFFAEFDLCFAEKVVFGLRYKPDLLVEEAGGTSYSGAWNSQQWQVQHFRKILSDRFVVLRDGITVLTTSCHNWQFSPRLIQVVTSHGELCFAQHYFSNSIDDQQKNRVISTTHNWSVFAPTIDLTISQSADPETILPLLIYSLYAALVVENA
jgi:hypothetical protein